MPVDTKLIFGLRTSEEDVTLTVTGQPGPRAPDLLITTSGQEKDTAIAYSAGAWIATLPAGDHVVRMEAPGDLWFEGGVSFTLSAASTIVSHGAATSPKPMGWVATTGAVDPKDPWPPPPRRRAFAQPDVARRNAAGSEGQRIHCADAPGYPAAAQDRAVADDTHESCHGNVTK